MSGRSWAAAVATVVLVLAACTSGGSASPGPSASGGSSGSPAASATPGEAASSASVSSASPSSLSASSGLSSPPGASRSPEASASPASVCRETRKPGTVKVSIADFEFKPTAIKARTGQVIGFTNTGFESHNATLDAAGCATKTLQTGGRDGLVFSAAGSYPFHCTVHAWMTGTITIGG